MAIMNTTQNESNGSQSGLGRRRAVRKPIYHHHSYETAIIINMNSFSLKIENTISKWMQKNILNY